MIAAASGEQRLAPSRSWLYGWIPLVAVLILVFALQSEIPWLARYPRQSVIPLADWLSFVVNFVKLNLAWLTRAISAAIAVPLDLAFGTLSKDIAIEFGDTTANLPRFSWVGIVALVLLVGRERGDWRLGALAGSCFLYIAVFGQWESAMLTLALIVICVPFCVAAGLLAGIWAHRSARAERYLITPALDLMQTVPTFAYLVPMLILFGNNPVSALIATAIYAIPPMVRATALALARVPQELGDLADMAGCTRRQKLWRVELPAARPTLMVGVNQVIMLSLNMVIISAMIGAGGLGYDVLLALRALRVGAALEAGLAIVALAIALDRLSQAAYRPPSSQGDATRRYIWAGVATLLITTALGHYVAGFHKVPEAMTLTTAPIWKKAVDWITLNYFDAIEAFRGFVLLHLLGPLKAFLLGLPWPAVTAVLGFAGWQLGGARLMLLVTALTLYFAATGLWEKTMITVYLCGFSSVVAVLIGFPLGILAGRSDIANRIIRPTVDTLQTLPSFVFIIPVVMLFRVGDVTAMIAVVSFAVAPAILYTSHGIRQVAPSLIEAAKTCGCTERQILWRVQLPLALPEIMLGVNQTILLALSMLVITAMVGTRDLGQEVFIGLAQANPGHGLVAGLAVAFIGIIADRLIRAASERTKRRLGLA